MVREFKISDTKQVKKIAEFIGLPKRPEHKTKFKEFADQFVVLYNQGTPFSEIAKILGVNVLTLQHWRKKLDLQSRRKVRFQVLKTKQIFEAVEDYVIHNRAVLMEDAVKDLSLPREKINNIRKQSSILDEFLLYLPSTSRIYYNTSDFYNDYSGEVIDVILYRQEDWESLMQKLIEIITPHINQNLIGSDWRSLLRNRLKNSTYIPPGYIDAIIDGILAHKDNYSPHEGKEYSRKKTQLDLEQESDVRRCLMILKDKEFSTYDLLKMLKNMVKQVRHWDYSEKNMAMKINSIMYDYVNEGRVQLFGHIKDDNFAYYCVQLDINNEERLEKEKTKGIAQTQPKVLNTHLYELPKPDVLSIDKVLDLFLNSDKSTCIKLSSLVLNLLGFSVKQNSTDVELLCSNDSVTLFVRVKAYELPAYSDVISVSALLKNEESRGLIITSQKAPQEIMKQCSNAAVDIWGYDQLYDILSGLPTMPSLEQYIVIVREGKFKGFLGIVKSTDYVQKRALVDLVNHPHHPVLACEIDHLQPLAFSPGSELYKGFIKEYTDFIYSNESIFDKISKLTVEDEYIVALSLRNISDLVLEEYDDSVKVKANIEGYVVSLETFKSEIDKISCDCLYWSDRSDKGNICRHIAYILLRVNYSRKDKLLEILTKWHYDKYSDIKSH